MVRGRSRRRSAGGCCHATAGSQGCASVSAAGYAALWPAGLDRHGQTSFIRCRDESYGGRRWSALRSVAQQSSRELTPTVPPTRRSDGQVQGHQDPAEIRLRSRLGPPPLQPPTPSQPPRHFQTSPRCCAGLAAATCSLKVVHYRFCRSNPVSLTMPPGVIHCRDAGGRTPYIYGGAGRGYRGPRTRHRLLHLVTTRSSRPRFPVIERCRDE